MNSLIKFPDLFEFLNSMKHQKVKMIYFARVKFFFCKLEHFYLIIFMIVLYLTLLYVWHFQKKKTERNFCYIALYYCNACACANRGKKFFFVTFMYDVPPTYMYGIKDVVCSWKSQIFFQILCSPSLPHKIFLHGITRVIATKYKNTIMLGTVCAFTTQRENKLYFFSATKKCIMVK